MSWLRNLSRAACLLATSVLVTVVATPIASSWAWAASAASQEARAHFDKASAAFALGHYPEAADSFEKAFEIKPDSALLYNAAQAHRLAGNKERALVLYQNYLRLYAKAPMRVEAEARVDELKKAIERDRVAATTPPGPTIATSSKPADPEPAASAPSPAAPVVDLRPPSPSAPPPTLAIRAPAVPPEPLTRKPLFWAAVAGGVAAVTVVVLVLASGGDRNPSPSLGVVK